MTDLQIRLFGPLKIGAHTPPTTNSRTLLSYLLLHPNRPHGRARLAHLLNPQVPEDRARRTLSQALWAARSVLRRPDETITTAGDTVTLHDDALAIDVQVFDALTEPLLARDTLDRAAANAAEQAVHLYTADLLADQYDDWLIAPRELRRERYLHTLAQLAAWEKQNQRLLPAVGHMITLTRADPLREAAHRELMRLYIALDRPHDAYQQFVLCRRLLRAELGIEPEPETVQLAATVQAEAPSADPAYVPLPALPTPYALQDSAHMPLVGRTAERRQLLAHLTTAAAHRRGGLMFVEGPPGIGKSRLLQEVARDAEWRGFAVGWGHGRDSATRRPYGLLREALAALLTPLRVTQLRTLLAPGWLRWAGTLLPAVADGTPPSDAAVDTAAPLAESLTRLTIALGRLKPLLLVLEDVHWADEATLETLFQLASRSADAPVLIMLSFRDGEARRQSAVWSALTRLDALGLRERLTLAPLSAAATADFVRHGLALDRDAPLFTRRLHRETAGSPLLLLETLRALHEEGVLYRDESGGWHTPYDADTAAYEEIAADTAERVQPIQRRLHHLAAPVRDLLALAAVIGREVDFGLLHAVAAAETVDVLDHLHTLTARQFLHETAVAYRFSHDKVRRAVYDRLDDAPRRRLHGRVAAALAEQTPTAVDLLAHHTRRAGQWPAAIDYTRRAAQQAADLYAHEDALAQYAGLYDLLIAHAPADTAARFETLLAMEALYGRVGRIEQQEAALQKAAELRPHLDTKQSARLLNRQAGYWLHTRSRPENAHPPAAEALAVARRHDHAAQQVQALTTLADIDFHRGRAEKSVDLYAQAWQLARTIPHNAAQAGGVLRSYIRNRIELGRRDGLDGLLDELVATAEAADDSYLLAMAHGERAAAAFHLGRYPAAIVDLEAALALYRDLGLAHKEAVTVSNLGMAQWGVLDYAQGERLIRHGLKIYESIKNERGELYAYANLVELYLQIGRWVTAERCLQRGFELAARQENMEMRVFLLKSQLLLHIAHGRAAALDETLAAIETVAAAHHAPYLRGMASVARAEAAVFRRDWPPADDAYRQAIAHMAAGERAWAQPPLLCGRARALWAQDRLAEAAELIHRAVQEDEIYNSDEGTKIHWWAYRILGEDAYLQHAYEQMRRRADGLPPEWRADFAAVPLHRDVEAAWQAQQPTTQTVRLPRVDAPPRGALTAAQQIEMKWTTADPADEQVSGKKARRHHRLRRLLREAAEQGARPTRQALADALGVSLATIKRDLRRLKDAEED